MAATCTVHIQCPDCGVALPITMQTWSTSSDHNVLQLVFEPDYTDVWAHAWTHDMA
ncbi:hypothetical protein ACFVZH_02725 [Streptomyces sp. NPDC059534]|uniref:hypothetical protein n=1 Tax=Streptomyces sp. NPDC059534 TaxID=3346859 RepID=UPI0036B0445B